MSRKRKLDNDNTEPPEKNPEHPRVDGKAPKKIKTPKPTEPSPLEVMCHIPSPFPPSLLRHIISISNINAKTQVATSIINLLLPITFKPQTYGDIHFSPRKIKIGSKNSHVLDHFARFKFPEGSTSSEQSQKCLLTISPNLNRLITKDWFLSLQSFTFQWGIPTNSSSSGVETKTLLSLAKIFEYASQLPNLRTFAWFVGTHFGCDKNEDYLKELPISQSILSSNNLFPRVETMKICFYSHVDILVTIPIQFFESYLERTRCLSELQLKVYGQMC